MLFYVIQVCFLFLRNEGSSADKNHHYVFDVIPLGNPDNYFLLQDNESSSFSI